ncbi:hypothetical protein RHSIM_Rhsim01G0075400 [Rhododendron simsii]|uniref:Uncharacterized protein n=1 Tax=Rhododendron simsii TaxID=118357 RepID=A0A834HEH3_RHOSS|nr:hypothetical protein RHSIM_Rhsim01G0075400 [Rhododendron simsii]
MLNAIDWNPHCVLPDLYLNGYTKAEKGEDTWRWSTRSAYRSSKIPNLSQRNENHWEEKDIEEIELAGWIENPRMKGHGVYAEIGTMRTRVVGDRGCAL